MHNINKVHGVTARLGAMEGNNLFCVFEEGNVNGKELPSKNITQRLKTKLYRFVYKNLTKKGTTLASIRDIKLKRSIK